MKFQAFGKIPKSNNKIGLRKPEYPEKTTDLSQVIDKLSVVSSTPRHERGSNSQR
jgi:hypothetical protein